MEEGLNSKLQTDQRGLLPVTKIEGSRGRRIVLNPPSIQEKWDYRGSGYS
ncbi:hypothetical protein FACS1894152_7720 [Bacilli bacterium]|nr:hypothetical protein FACS1894152_7720 [Bacilli bacterium]